MERVPLDKLVADPGNPRGRTERGRATLLRSMQQFGPARSAVVDGSGIIRAGHGTIEAAKAAGIKEAIIIDAPDDALVVVRKPGWTDAQAKAYVVADNQCTDLSVFEDDPLAERFHELEELEFDLEETGFELDEIKFLLEDVPAPGGEPEAEEGDPDFAPEDLFGPWESDNDWGVPTLLLEHQARDLPSPILKWGARSRKSKVDGSYHFYEDDYKFWGLQRNPQVVVQSGVRVAVEPNYSTWADMSRAEALWWIYSKRTIARWWQSRGLKVVVDLNVDLQFADLTLLGVPRGWEAYAVRWQRDDKIETLEALHDQAAGRAGKEDFLFVVFGGRDKVRKECDLRGWGHVPEDSALARGER